MITTTLQELAVQNLTDTYMALGTSAGNGNLIDGDGVKGFVSAFPHPISNFAVVEHVTPQIAEELRRLSVDRPSFHVYISAQSNFRQERSALRRVGFRNTQSLFAMGSRPGSEARSLPLDREETAHDKISVAEFMMSQFPSSYPDWIRQEVKRATAEAQGLDLYSLMEDRRRIGALMLRRNDSCIGLYNLCVEESLRGNGYGKMLVQMTQRLGNMRNQPVILQCDRKLVSWYERLGFEPAGKIEVFVSVQNRW